MTGTDGAAPPTAVLALEIDEVWQRRAAGSSKFSDLRCPYHPPAAVESKAPLKLPSLVTAAKGSRRRCCTACLSLSEPSLLTPSENFQLEGFSSFRRSSVLQNHPPSPSSPIKSSTVPSCPTFHLSGAHERQKKQMPHSSLRPAFIHFSKAIRPSVRPRAVRRHSHNPALSSEAGRADLLTSAGLHASSSSSWKEPLSVVGKPCLLYCSQHAARSQLHIFLPSEAKAEEVDKESVDEGFMDELDIKIGSLKLQEEAAKTITSPS